jgi:hypothetical protein
MEHIIEIEVVADEVQSIVVVEELEPIAAPGVYQNHNETLMADEDDVELILVVEELETIAAPGLWTNHNETVMLD